MVLTTIFITRHGFRMNWNANRNAGSLVGGIRTPTGIESDVPLTAYGVVQSDELGELASVLEPKPSRIYTSPFYRCIQTIVPLWSKVSPSVPLICDRGLGEWYGKATFDHDRAASLGTLQGHFPGLAEQTTITPDIKGETLIELHERCARALASIIAEFDATSTSSEPEALIICSHAAPIITMGRALTGDMPDDPTREDFDTYTCSVSRFERKQPPGTSTLPKPLSLLDPLDWKAGRGVGGGWTCRENASVAHLKNGGERNWHFYGDESFVDFSETPEKTGSSPKL